MGAESILRTLNGNISREENSWGMGWGIQNPFFLQPSEASAGLIARELVLDAIKDSPRGF